MKKITITSPVSNKVDMMVERLGATDRLEALKAGAKPNPGKWAHLEGKQFASTQANLVRQATGEERNWDEPLPQSAKADADAERVFREVNKVSVQDVSLAEKARRAAKNELGQSEASSVTPEKREAAIHHFVVSPGVPAQELSENQAQHIAGLVEIVSAAPLVEVWKEIPWYKAIWRWVTGNKVKNDKKQEQKPW